MTGKPAPLSHACIVTGGSEAARLEHARQIAMARVCAAGAGTPCGACRHCKKAAAGIHPDVTVLSPLEGKREIGVDQVRALRADVYIRPNEAGRKVFLIHPAEAMNAAAQNALLKALEDGPAYAVFLLVCAQPGLLLATIRSRCAVSALPPEEEAADPALEERASELASLLLDGSDGALWELLCALERDKLKTGALQDLLARTEEALRPSLRTRPRETTPLLRLLRRCGEACAFNVGAGHLLGLLAAERGQFPSGGRYL